MKRKLIVISADAMVDADLPYLERQPNYSEIYKSASLVRHVRTIYPSITYPAHTSMISGVYPDKHGVYDNEELTVGAAKQPWNWFHHAVKVPDLFDAAKAAGLTTASVYWPATGNHPSIDYLVDEYWPQFEGDTLEAAFRRSGTSEQLMRDVVLPNMQDIRMRLHPEADDMGAKFACEIIRRYNPDLLVFHPANIDEFRHKYGLFNEYVDEALRDTDRWLGDIIQATKDAGTFGDTNFILMSDHGQMNVNRVMNLNVLLADNGLVKLDAGGNVISWDAFIHSAAMCAFVFLRPGADDALRARVHKLLQAYAREGIYGISEVFTRAEIQVKERLSGDFDFVVESDGYTTFGQRVVRPLVTALGEGDYRYGHATHGYLPDKGPQPVFIAWGPDVKRGVELERRPIVDAAPTMARLLGIELVGADGVAVEEMLR